MGKVSARASGKEQLWQERIAAWRASGQSVRSFCAARQLSEASFYFWRRELARREARPRFAAVRVLPSPSAPNPSLDESLPGGVMELLIGGGLVLRLAEQTGCTRLAEIVRALSSAGQNPC